MNEVNSWSCCAREFSIAVAIAVAIVAAMSEWL